MSDTIKGGEELLEKLGIATEALEAIGEKKCPWTPPCAKSRPNDPPCVPCFARMTLGKLGVKVVSE